MKSALSLRTGLMLGCLSICSAPALAVNSIPEPGSLALFTAGGIIGAVLAIRKRRK